MGGIGKSEKKSVEIWTRGRGEFGIKRLIQLGVGRMSRTKCVQGSVATKASVPEKLG